MNIGRFFKSKTINFATLLGIFGLVEANWNIVAPYLGDNQGWVYTGIAAIVAGLRAVTNEPLKQKLEIETKE